MINRLHGGDIESLPAGRSIVDFSVNINPLGMPTKAKAALIKNIADVSRYPQPGSRSLIKALAFFHSVKADNIAVGNGSIELIYLIPQALGAEKILIITPTFSEYELASRVSGAKIIFYKTEERKGFRIELCKLERFLSQVNLVFLGNPNNPTGSCLDAVELSLLGKLCARHKVTLVIDEAFMDFAQAGEENSFILAALSNKHLLIVRSLTKFFALVGLRIGYAVGHRELISKIASLQYPWNINSLAQIAGRIVLEDRGYINRSRRYVAKEREFLLARLKSIKGLEVFNPKSNFILCKLDGAAIKSAKLLNQRLVKKGLVVRDCGNFRGLNRKFFRLAVRNRDENCRLISALREALSR